VREEKIIIFSRHLVEGIQHGQQPPSPKLIFQYIDVSHLHCGSCELSVAAITRSVRIAVRCSDSSPLVAHTASQRPVKSQLQHLLSLYTRAVPRTHLPWASNDTLYPFRLQSQASNFSASNFFGIIFSDNFQLLDVPNKRCPAGLATKDFIRAVSGLSSPSQHNLPSYVL
jgi:hypothetical protein